jgi:hypothetical protein
MADQQPEQKDMSFLVESPKAPNRYIKLLKHLLYKLNVAEETVRIGYSSPDYPEARCYSTLLMEILEDHGQLEEGIHHTWYLSLYNEHGEFSETLTPLEYVEDREELL